MATISDPACVPSNMHARSSLCVPCCVTFDYHDRDTTFGAAKDRASGTMCLSCLRNSPHQITDSEIETIRDLVTSHEYWHVPTGTLAILAQRIGKVYASVTTWYRLVDDHQWRRPRQRVYPAKPKVGIRASGSNQIWHIDTTLIRLLDGSRAYLHAVIDIFSRRILAWKVSPQFDPEATAEILLAAAKGVDDTEPDTLISVSAFDFPPVRLPSDSRPSRSSCLPVGSGRWDERDVRDGTGRCMCGCRRPGRCPRRLHGLPTRNATHCEFLVTDVCHRCQEGGSAGACGAAENTAQCACDAEGKRGPT